VRLAEQESTRDVRDIFVDQQQVITTTPLLVQVTPDYSYEQPRWPETTNDRQVPALNSLLRWLEQQEVESGITNVSVNKIRKYAPILDGHRGSKGQEGKEGKRGRSTLASAEDGLNGRRGRKGIEGVVGAAGEAGAPGAEGVAGAKGEARRGRRGRSERRGRRGRH